MTLTRALRLLGLGTDAIVEVPIDGQARMRADVLHDALRTAGPTIVCAQAGEVNTGVFDPLEEIVSAAGETGAWVHVDGAFGLWAAASPALSHLVAGAERADSWAVDGHKCPWPFKEKQTRVVFCGEGDKVGWSRRPGWRRKPFQPSGPCPRGPARR